MPILDYAGDSEGRRVFAPIGHPARNRKESFWEKKMNVPKIEFVPTPNLKNEWKAIVKALGIDTEKISRGIENTKDSILLEFMADIMLTEEMVRIIEHFEKRSNGNSH